MRCFLKKECLHRHLGTESSGQCEKEMATWREPARLTDSEPSLRNGVPKRARCLQWKQLEDPEHLI